MLIPKACVLSKEKFEVCFHLQKLCDGGAIIPISDVGKSRLREMNELAQDQSPTELQIPTLDIALPVNASLLIHHMGQESLSAEPQNVVRKGPRRSSFADKLNPGL